MEFGEDKEPAREARRNEWRGDATVAAGDEPHRILVVDDNDDSRDYLALVLELAGHRVESVGDGFQALEVAERLRPDIVFLDLQMPKLTGYDVCRHMRSTQWGRGMRIYAVTGLSRVEDFSHSRQCGFDGHLVKPIDPVLLNSLLARPTATAWEHDPRVP